jgi:hypothetical protein
MAKRSLFSKRPSYLQILDLYLQQLARGIGFSFGILIISQLAEQIFVF